VGFRYSAQTDTLSNVGYQVCFRPTEVLGAIKDAGYEGADLQLSAARIHGVEKLRQAAQSADLKIPEILGNWAYFYTGEYRDLTRGDPEARKRGMKYAKESIDMAVTLGSQYFSICTSQPPEGEIPFPKQPVSALRRRFLEAVKEICAYADDRGVTILFEPLNIYEAGYGVLHNLQQAVGIVKELASQGVKNTGVQPDIFHAWMEEASVPESIRAAGKLVKVVHLNDTHRNSLGTGQAEYPQIFRALRGFGFDGYISVYMPRLTREVWMRSLKDHPIRPDLKAHLSKELAFAKGVEATVDLQEKIFDIGVPYLRRRPASRTSTKASRRRSGS
jgi:sugar phosphate isomerase/epimerase